MYFGFDERSFYLRLDLLKWSDISLEVKFFHPPGVVLKTGTLTRKGRQNFTLTTAGGKTFTQSTFAAEDIIEWRVALADLGLKPNDPVSFQVQILQEGIERESYPESGPIQLTVPAQEFAITKWIV
jgi:hypothetical protein